MNRRQFFAAVGLALAGLACSQTFPAEALARNRDGTGPDGRGCFGDGL